MEAIDPLRVVITGSKGQLGTAFRALLGDKAIYLDRSTLDLGRPETIGPTLKGLSPDLVINCAAFTAVDLAESERDLARRVNAISVGEMARACRALGGRFVTFSTDYVFSGTKNAPYLESDPPTPVNVYGSTKLEGERETFESGDEALVIRTSWLISSTHENFVFKVLEQASNGQTRVVNDQRGCATIAADLATGTWNVIRAGVTGMLHLTNQTEFSWFELARAGAELAGLDANLIEPTSSSQFATKAIRPTNSVLGSERPREVAIAALPPLHDSLPDVIAGWRHWRSQPRVGSSRR